MTAASLVVLFIAHGLCFFNLCIMTAIMSAANLSQPPVVPSYWNHLTSTVAINAWLRNVRVWQSRNSEALDVEVVPAQVAYMDRSQKQRSEH